jgi:hypothetical protein
VEGLDPLHRRTKETKKEEKQRREEKCEAYLVQACRCEWKDKKGSFVRAGYALH